MYREPTVKGSKLELKLLIASLDRVILDVGPCLSWLQILLSSPLLPARFLLTNQLSLMGTPLQVTVSFSFAAFKILCLSFILGNVVMMCLGVCFLESNFLFGVEGRDKHSTTIEWRNKNFKKRQKKQNKTRKGLGTSGTTLNIPIFEI